MDARAEQAVAFDRVEVTCRAFHGGSTSFPRGSGRGRRRHGSLLAFEAITSLVDDRYRSAPEAVTRAHIAVASASRRQPGRPGRLRKGWACRTRPPDRLSAQHLADVALPDGLWLAQHPDVFNIWLTWRLEHLRHVARAHGSCLVKQPPLLGAPGATGRDTRHRRRGEQRGLVHAGKPESHQGIAGAGFEPATFGL